MFGANITKATKTSMMKDVPTNKRKQGLSLGPYVKRGWVEFKLSSTSRAKTSRPAGDTWETPIFVGSKA